MKSEFLNHEVDSFGGIIALVKADKRESTWSLINNNQVRFWGKHDIIIRLAVKFCRSGIEAATVKYVF